MFFNYIKSVYKKNIGLYIFSFALSLGKTTLIIPFSFDGNNDFVEIIPDGDIISSDQGVTFNFYFKNQALKGTSFSLTGVRILALM